MIANASSLMTQKGNLWSVVPTYATYIIYAPVHGIMSYLYILKVTYLSLPRFEISLSHPVPAVFNKT